MKRIIILTLSILTILSIKAQTTIVTNGNYYQKNSISISYTIGGVVIGSFSKENMIMNNGLSDLDSKDFITSVIVNVNQGYNTEITAYPNPVEKVLNINNVQNAVDYTIYNSIGQIMTSGTIDPVNNSIDFISITSGNYVLLISERGKKVKTINIIKK